MSLAPVINSQYDPNISIWKDVPVPSIHPFLSGTPNLTAYEKFKRYLGYFIMIPIRIIFALLVLLLATIIVKIGFYKADLERPLPPWRNAFKTPIRYLYRALLFVLGVYWVETKGSPAGVEEAPIIVANHITFLDQFYMESRYAPMVVSRIQNSQIPVLKNFYIAFQHIFVDRLDSESRRRASSIMISKSRETNVPTGFEVPSEPPMLSPVNSPTMSPANSVPSSPSRREIVDTDIHNRHSRPSVPLLFPIGKLTVKPSSDSRKVQSNVASGLSLTDQEKEKGRRWPQILVFPEGTTGNGRSLLQFKIGPFAPCLPVQPVIIRYPFRHFDVAWVGAGPEGGELGLRLLSQFRQKMTVEFLPVYVPSMEERLNPKLFTSNVKKVMSEALYGEMKCSEHNYDDVLLLTEAKMLGVPVVEVNVETYYLNKKMGMNLDTVCVYLRLFAKYDKKKLGYLVRSDFDEICTNKVLADALFKEYDPNNIGTVRFREFLIASAVLNKGCGTKSTIYCAKMLTNIVTNRGSETDRDSIQDKLSFITKENLILTTLLDTCLEENNTINIDQLVQQLSKPTFISILDKVATVFNISIHSEQDGEKKLSGYKKSLSKVI